jgi:hypothetical protein
MRSGLAVAQRLEIAAHVGRAGDALAAVVADDGQKFGRILLRQGGRGAQGQAERQQRTGGAATIRHENTPPTERRP